MSAPTSALTFGVLRHRVVLENPAFAEVVTQALGHHALGEPSMTLRVRRGEGVCREAGVNVHTTQGPLPLVTRGQRWALSGGRVRGAFGADITELEWPQTPTPTERVAQHLALYEAGRMAGLLPLHAAVLSRRGRGVAIFGESGAGKSTAALRLLSGGWQLVAEDSAWLSVETRQVVGAGSGLRLQRASLERFAPEWLSRPLPRDIHGKYMLPAEAAGPVTLDEIYLLTPAKEPLSPAAALKYWWAATGVPITPLARQAAARQLGAAARGFPLQAVERDQLIRALK